MNDEIIIDLQKQCELIIKSLNAILPYCVQGGIEVLRNNAYDEWEDIVWAIYFSFVVHPVSDAGAAYASSEFHKLGFQVSGPKRVIKLEYSNKDYFIFDLATNDLDRGVFLELLPYPFCKGAMPVFVKPSEAKDFSVAVVKS